MGWGCGDHYGFGELAYNTQHYLHVQGKGEPVSGNTVGVQDLSLRQSTMFVMR